MNEPARIESEAPLSAEELQDKYRRALAELENHRRRAAKDVVSARTEGEERALGLVVGLYDDFIRAIQAIESTKGRNAKEQVLEGVTLLFGKFKHVLTQLEVEGFSAAGEQFSAALMEAIGQVPSRTLPPGTVAEQLAQGFTRRGRLLRPAQVLVATAAPEDDRDPGE